MGCVVGYYIIIPKASVAVKLSTILMANVVPKINTILMANVVPKASIILTGYVVIITYIIPTVTVAPEMPFGKLAKAGANVTVAFIGTDQYQGV